MAITDPEKIDFLLKKVGYELAKTDKSNKKGPSNESKPSPITISSQNLWLDTIPPNTGISSPSVIKTFTILNPDVTSTIVNGQYPTWMAPSGDWISPAYGSDYIPKVYVADSGNYTTAASLPSPTTILPAGSGTDAYFVDYIAGIINFADSDLPSSLKANPNRVLYLEGYRYVGSKGTQVSVSGHKHTSSDITDFNSSVSGLLTPYSLSSVTLTAGSGLVGGGNLTNNRSFDIGQGDGISVSADSIAVDSTVVRTSGSQIISGVKTLETPFITSSTATNYPHIRFDSDNTLGIKSVSSDFPDAGGARELLIGKYTGSGQVKSDYSSNTVLFAGSSGVGVSTLYDGGSGFNNSRLIFDVQPNISTGTSNTILRTAFISNGTRIINLPGTSGTLALSSDINTSQITGVLSSAKGGTGRSTYLDGQLLIGSGTSLAANTLTQGTGISISNGSGTITINVDSTVVNTTGTQTINGSKTFGNAATFNAGLSVNNNKITSLAEPTASGDAATKNYVDSQITAGFSVNDAMVFKGLVTQSSGLPTSVVSAGWTYRVAQTGTYAGVVCEIGDMIIAVADAAGNVNSTWTVVQTNLDGAVIGPVSSTDNRIALFDGTSGKLIKQSSLLISDIVSNTRTIAISGTTNQIISSAGSQDLSADRTWTLSLPQNIHTAATPTFGGITIDGTINARAGASASAATQIVVFTGDPSAITRAVVTRTPAQLLSDIGAGTVSSITAGSGMSFTTITNNGPVTLGIPSNITLSGTNSLTSNSHTHAFAPGGSATQYIRGDGSLNTFPTIPTVNDATLTLNVSGIGLSGSQTFTSNQSTPATFTVTSNATSANTASTIVARDASNNFSAGTITATLNGSASTLTTSRTFTIGASGKAFNGSADISWTLAEIGAAATNQNMFIGTTQVAINRASNVQALSGVSIDGNAATATTSTNTNNIAINLSTSNINNLIFTSGTNGNLPASVNNNLRFDAANNILIGSSGTSPIVNLNYFVIDGGTP